MKTRRIEVIKPIIEDNTDKHINFGGNRKNKGTVITETDLFAKIILGSANVLKQKFQKIFLKS